MATTDAAASGTVLDAQQDFGWALGTLLRAYMKATADAVAEVPGGPRGYQVLVIAGGGSCSNQAAIAESVGLDRTVMTYLIDDLEKAGLVVRTPDPHDRRARRVSLTDVGRTTVDTLTARVHDAETKLLSTLDPEESEALRSIVGRAARSADASGAVDATEVCNTIDEARPRS